MINNNPIKPIIYLIRHARSVYNQAQAALQQSLKQMKQVDMEKTSQYIQMKFKKDYQDCDITQFGKKQCLQCRQKMKDVDLDLIIVSPLRRALSTCHQVFKDHKSKAPIIVDPLFRQIFESKCDIGSRLRQSMRDYPDFDYSLIENPDSWYINQIKNQQQKNKITEKLKSTNQNEYHKAAQDLMLQYLKDLWERRQISTDHKTEALSPIKEQKAKLKLLLQKYKSIAIVTHSENIKTYSGIKPPNCSIMLYKPDYFQKAVSQIPHDYL